MNKNLIAFGTAMADINKAFTAILDITDGDMEGEMVAAFGVFMDAMGSRFSQEIILRG